MRNYKSSPQRLAYLFKQGRDQWQQRATEKQKKLRSQAIRIRDLEASRALWKQRAQLAEQALRELQPATDSTETPEKKNLSPPAGGCLVFADEYAERVRHHHYSLGIMCLAIRLVVESLVSLRGVAHQFELWNEVGVVCPTPSYSTIREWVLRVGCYEWQRPKASHEDWIFIVDMTIELGPYKCLVVLGIRQSEWAQLAQQAEHTLHHQDMEVLQISVMRHTKGVQIQQQIEQVSAQVGTPVQIVSDHGSDVKKGIDLYQQDHPQVIYTYDVTHQTARLLKAELTNDEAYQTLVQRCARVRQQLQQSALSFLMPPIQRAKSRYLNVESLLSWVNQILQYHQQQEFALIDPHFCLDALTLQALSTQVSLQQGQPLLALQDKVYPNRNAFIQALQQHSIAATLHPLLLSLADCGKRKFEQVFGWLLESQAVFHPYQQMLTLVSTLQEHLKTKGLTTDSLVWFETQTQELDLSPRLQAFRAKLIDYLVQQTQSLPAESKFIATSDVIESIFGKYKLFSARTPLKQMGHLLLILPLLTVALSAQKIQSALEQCSFEQVEAWFQETFGASALAKRRTAFQPPQIDTKIA